MRECLAKKLKRTMSMFLTVCLTVSLFTMNTAWAAEATKAWTKTEKVSTSEEYKDIVGECYEAKTPLNEDDALYVSGKTKPGTKMLLIRLRGLMKNIALSNGEEINNYINTFVKPEADGRFSVKIDTSIGNMNTPIAYMGTVLSAADKAYDAMPGYKAVPAMPQGFYALQITAAMTDADAEVCNGAEWYTKDHTLGGDHGFVWEDVILYASGSVASTTVTNNPKLVEFTDIININKQVQTADKLSDPMAYARYTDVYLKDLNYVLKDENYESKPMNTERVAYIKSVAEEITAGATTDAQKLAKIYQYVADNYYYDFYAHKLYLNTDTNLQCANPYDNLYNLRNKIASTNSTSDGKVATCCDGYSALIVSLCRSLGMPARVVIGCTNNMSDGVSSKVDATKQNHWWSEVYINGRWVTVDAERGSLNSWNRDELSLNKQDSRFRDDEYKKDVYWDYQGWKSSGLDMSYNARAASFMIVGIQDSTDGQPFLQDVTITNEIVSGKPKLTWTPMDGYVNYYIYRGTKESDISYYSSTRGASSFVDTNAQAGVTYYYTVRPVNSAGSEAARCNVVSIVCKNPTNVTPNAPTLSISKSAGKINLSWNAVNGATKYWIYRSTDGTNFKHYDTTTKTSYTNGSVTSGTKYYYKVKAVVTADGKDYASAYSTAKSTIPMTTPALKVSLSAGSAKLSWAAVSGATKYWVYRSTDGTNFKYYDSTTKTSYTNSSVTGGNTYYYKVKAVKTVGTTDWTSDYSAAGSVKVLKAPTVSISKTAGKIKLSWTAVSGATKYWVYRSTDGTNFKYYDTTTNTSYTNSSVTSGTKYYYKVKAVNSADGTSLYSAVKSTVPMTTPTLSATVSSGKVKLSWGSVTGATKYWVYRSTDGKNFSYYTSTTNTIYTNSSVTAGKTYYYKIKAVKTVSSTDWASDYSNVVSKKP